MSEHVVQPQYQKARSRSLRIDYEKSLNPQQLAAVTAPPGPSLVIAGAGSGKTRTLTFRVAYLLEQGVPADQLLLLTFTNKAAAEMMSRVRSLLGSEIQYPWGGTFHSIANKILRLHAPLLGYNPGYTILDREDSLELLKSCLKELNLDPKQGNIPRIEVVAEIISHATNSLKPLEKTIEDEYPYLLEYVDCMKEVEALYCRRKRETNVMDFDDLLSLFWKLMQEFPSVLSHYQNRFQHILVDEYQDTNKLQSQIVDLLAAKTKNLMVVGDDAQSIYGWRGADFENILTFPIRYPDARVYRIEYNYRSTPEILKLANAAIAKNTRQHRKNLTPVRPSGCKPMLVLCTDSHQQASFVSAKIRELNESGIAFSEIAVLYRSHFHAMELQMELTRAQIPFVITSGIRFFEQAHIKDITAYLKLMINPADELSFRRIMLTLPGVGPRTVDKMWMVYISYLQATQSTPIADTNLEKETTPKPRMGSYKRLLPDLLEQLTSLVPSKSRRDWSSLIELIKELTYSESDPSPANVLRKITNTSFNTYLSLTYDNYRQRIEDIEQLTMFAEQFDSLEEFLAQLALLSNIESEESRPLTQSLDAVRLSTVHQAKGLEFEAVFVIMLCEGLFPNARAVEIRDGLEEERRLFYVAVTRAKTYLFLCYPEFRFTPGRKNIEPLQISRFIAEIPPELYESLDLRSEYHLSRDRWLPPHF